jgi:hypothetical protein
MSAFWLVTSWCFLATVAYVYYDKYKYTCINLSYKEKMCDLYKDAYNHTVKQWGQSINSRNKINISVDKMHKEYPITSRLLYVFDQHCQRCTTRQDVFNIYTNNPDKRFSVNHERVKPMSGYDPVILNIDHSLPAKKPQRNRSVKIDVSEFELGKLLPIGNGEFVAVDDAATTMRTRCPRCKRYHDIIDNYDNLCDRCVTALINDFPNHESVPHIKANICQQQAKWLKV